MIIGVHSLDKLLKDKMKKNALEEMKQKNKLKMRQVI